VTYLIEE